MKIHELKSPRGSKKGKKVVGRGPGSGHGKTSCRGENGQRSRSGRWVVGPHEGGQSRLIRRLPKMGFRSHRPISYQVVNVEQLEAKFKKNDIVDAKALKSGQLIGGLNQPVKILGKGNIKKALTIQIKHYSKSAKEKIEKAGGKFESVQKESNENNEIKNEKK